MKIIEIGTGYTSIPARMGAATEIVVEELTKAFIDLGQTVQLVDIADEDRLPTQLPITPVKMPHFFSSTDVQLGILHKLKRVLYSVALTKTLKKIIQEEQDEIVLHFHNQYNLYFFLKLAGKAVRNKVKIAYTVHSYIWAGDWEEIGSTVQKRYFQEIYCVQNADYVLVLNDKTTAHFTEHLGVKRENIHKISNGVNTQVYHRLSQEERERIKSDLGFADKRILFQVGSVCDRKNQLGAVEMLCKYLVDHKNTVYMYAGGVIDEEYQQKIIDFARENQIADQVSYVGELCPGEQLNNYYNLADVTVFPSKLESFGLVIIESLSAGTPVILSGEPPFVLQSGYRVFGSKEELIRMVDEAGVGQEEFADVLEPYSWGSIARQHADLFGQL